MKLQDIKNIDLGLRQLSLFDLDPAADREDTQILSHIISKCRTRGHALLEDLLQEIKEEKGIEESIILQNIFWSALELKIHFRTDENIISPSTAKQMLLNDVSRGKSLKIITNKPVDPTLFQEMKTWYAQLTDSAPPDPDAPQHNGDQYTLSVCLSSLLKKWKTRLKSFKPLARKPFYPGKETIHAHLEFLTGLLARQDSHTLITNCHKHQNKVMDMAREINVISDFYLNRIPFWDTLVDSMENFLENEAEIKKNPDLYPALERLNRILRSPSPYDLIPEALDLFNRVETANIKIERKKRSDHQAKAVSQVDAMIQKLLRAYRQSDLDTDLCNRRLYRLRQVKKQISHMNALKKVDRLLESAKDLYADFMEEL